VRLARVCSGVLGSDRRPRGPIQATPFFGSRRRRCTRMGVGSQESCCVHNRACSHVRSARSGAASAARAISDKLSGNASWTQSPKIAAAASESGSPADTRAARVTATFLSYSCCCFALFVAQLTASSAVKAKQDRRTGRTSTLVISSPGWRARRDCSRADARSSLANARDRPRQSADVQLGSGTRQVVELPAACGGVGSSNPTGHKVRAEDSRRFVSSRARRDSNSRPSGSKPDALSN
jgi:hypothetical protein